MYATELVSASTLGCSNFANCAPLLHAVGTSQLFQFDCHSPVRHRHVRASVVTFHWQWRPMSPPIALACLLCLALVSAQMHTWSNDNIKPTCSLTSGDTVASVQADGTITTVPRPTLTQLIERYSLWPGLYNPADGEAETVPFMCVVDTHACASRLLQL